jgi:hypothetical protein
MSRRSKSRRHDPSLTSKACEMRSGFDLSAPRPWESSHFSAFLRWRRIKFMAKACAIFGALVNPVSTRFGHLIPRC